MTDELSPDLPQLSAQADRVRDTTVAVLHAALHDSQCMGREGQGGTGRGREGQGGGALGHRRLTALGFQTLSPVVVLWVRFCTRGERL